MKLDSGSCPHNIPLKDAKSSGSVELSLFDQYAGGSSKSQTIDSDAPGPKQT